MKKIIIASLFLFPTLSFAQSRSEICKGDFTLPKYEERFKWDLKDEESNDITFEDGVKGTLFYDKDCNRFYVKTAVQRWHYNSYDDALKALYAYKKIGCNIENHYRGDCD